jgi:predicted nuclease of restriction endonuclease-like RecB superfamily
VQSAADELDMSPEQVEATLFADRTATYLLSETGPQWTPSGLVARYNLELARGVLYWASQVRIEVHSNYKDLWKYLKLFKLMSWITPQPDGYLVDLDGPISPFVSATTRYGRQFAAFLPALLLCEQWRMAATVYPPQLGKPATYRLDHTSSLQTHFKQSGQFDSRLEADFAQEFEEKFGDKRGHWLLTRENDLLPLGDTVMIPDFALVDKHDAQRKILIELVGFWHPDYLRRKVEKVRAANCQYLLLLVYKGLQVTEDAFEDTASEVIFFQNKPVLKEVMTTVEEMAERLYGPRPKREKRQRATKPPAQK